MMESIVIGRFVKAHGLKGHVLLVLEEGMELKWEEVKFLLPHINGSPTPFFIEQLNPQANKLIVKFETINSETEARKLLQQPVEALKEWTQAKASSPLDDFIGFEVVDANEGILGKIISVEEFPQHPVFILHYKEKEILLPAITPFIEEVNEQEKKILYRAPEGLLQVYLA